MKFRLVKGAGPHRADGQTFTSGQVVTSPDDLASLFPGKFERLEGTIKADEEGKLSETHTPFDTPVSNAPSTVGGEVLDDEEEPGTARGSSSRATTRSRKGK